MFDTSVFRNIKTPSDFAREEQEFEFRKRQRELQEKLGSLSLEQAQRKLNTPMTLEMPKLKTLAEQALLKRNMGIPLNAQEEAAIQSMGQINPPVYTKDEFGHIRVAPGGWSSVMNLPPRQAMRMPAPAAGRPSQQDYGTLPPLPDIAVNDLPPPAGSQNAQDVDPQLMEDIMGSMGYEPEPTAQPAPVSQPATPQVPVIQPPQAIPITLPNIDPRAQTSPSRNVVAQEAIDRANIQAQLDANKANIADRIKQAQALRRAGKAQPIIAKTLDELETLNNKLRVKGALASGDNNALQNLSARLGTTKFGQTVTGVSNVDIQTLRNQYDLARNSLIPFYVDYFDLPATMVDTEEMATRIIQSFGDPTLDYETNQTAVNRMRGQFGLETNGGSGAPKRRRFNPATGRLE